jgi:hypothetical protein
MKISSKNRFVLVLLFVLFQSVGLYAQAKTVEKKQLQLFLKQLNPKWLNLPWYKLPMENG